jgi:thiamine biosynthesis lipoprotein
LTDSSILLRSEEIMGTRITVDLRDRLGPDVLESAFAWLRWVDATFTTFRADSEVASINRGELTESQASPQVREVLAACRLMRDRSGGAFDAEAAAQLPEVRRRPGSGGGRRGAVEPAGYVKGWALDLVWEQLALAGAQNALLEAGGDFIARGCPAPGRSWRIGIQHPVELDRVAAVIEGRNLAVATSGEYRRGAHIVDPATGGRPRGLLSVSVVSRSLAVADACATAAFAMGETGAGWLAREDGVEAMVVGEDEVVRTTPGFDALVASAEPAQQLPRETSNRSKLPPASSVQAIR